MTIESIKADTKAAHETFNNGHPSNYQPTLNQLARLKTLALKNDFYGNAIKLIEDAEEHGRHAVRNARTYAWA